ncbi:hypothetical protein FOL47_009331 [Perkinsus chesapeaki]|uniref:Uncharacterized protein n=1 Tax=Perkinsus chesapeaki TaxID=330153 RepID=A0A7J6L8Y8_PERCH|nr:hypothetical protein FOL47_009331 [Perkinsus chesapeaki]
MGCASSKVLTLDQGDGPTLIKRNLANNNTAAAAATATPVSTKDGSEIAGRRRRHHFESMTEDQLIHKGIACVQEASVTKDKFRRERQLKKAKGLLMEALQRQQGRDRPVSGNEKPREGDAVTVHLAAVLLSLGEDPDDVRRMLGMSTPRKSPSTLQTMSTVDSAASYTATAAASPDLRSSPGTPDVFRHRQQQQQQLAAAARQVSVQLLDEDGQLESATTRDVHNTQNAGPGRIAAVRSEVSYEPEEPPQSSPPLPNCAPSDVLLKYHAFMQNCPSPAAFSPAPSRYGSESESLQIWVDQRRGAGSRRDDSAVGTPCGWYADEDESEVLPMDESASVIEFDPDNDEPLSDEKCDELLSEIVSQAGSSIGHSPASSVGSDWQSADFDPLLLDNRDKSLSVYLHCGITGELLSRFDIPLQDERSIDQLYSDLEDSLQQNCGLGLSETHWVRENQKIRCDKRMLVSALSPTGHCELRMCTVPKTPPAEMDIYSGGAQGSSIRLKSLIPHSLSPGRVATLTTTPLRRGLDYSVVLVSQMDSGNSCWLSGKSLLIDHKLGVIQFALSDMQIKSLLRRTQDGLFDVYLVVDGSLRSENRRTVVVVDNSGFTPNAQTGDGDVSDGDSSDSCDSSDVASWAEFDPIL